MNRRPSRLHALERGLKLPRGPRRQAPAVTVMRLEGAASGAQSSTRPPPLPKDLEDQIAVVRGRAVGKPSRGLLQLEERLLRTHDAEPTSPVIQRHEHGVMRLPAIHAPAPLVRAASVSDSVFGGSYSVEPFADTASNPAKTQPDAANAAPIQASPVSMAAASKQSKRGKRQNALTPDQQAVAGDFERDLAAMVGPASAAKAPEDRQWDERHEERRDEYLRSKAGK